MDIMHVESSFPHVGEQFFLRVEQEQLQIPSAELAEDYITLASSLDFVKSAGCISKE
jgi:hypothetical protein